MDCCCEDKTITIYKGFPTKWNGKSLLNVTFDNPLDFAGFSAIFKIGNTQKTYTDIAEGFKIDLTKEETGALPVGLNYGELIIIDNETHKRPFTTALPFNVLTFVEGDIHLDGFNVDVKTKIKNNNLVIHIETPTIDPEEIAQYIEAHNLSEEAHPYIRGLISQESETRELADNNLQTQINEIRTLAVGYVHEQGVASAVWTVQHNLNKYPSVTVVDSAENEIIAEVEYLDKNSVQITMTGASKGRAYLN